MSPSSPSVRHLLHDDHRRLDAIFGELQAAAESDVDAPTLQGIWRLFDTGLRAHLSAEESLLFPLLEGEHADEVAFLRAEHDALRGLLEEVGVEVDLHVVREGTVKRLLDRLRAHAARENQTVYPWAESEVHDEGLMGRLLGLLRVGG